MYRVFLVDDESLIRAGIREMIAWEEHGFSFVGEAADGELAWPLIQKLKPDIVLTDIKMPFMDGLALSKLIKRELPDTMIIIISGYDEFSYAREAVHIGVHEYLLKPIGKKQMIDLLVQIKKRKDEEQARAQNEHIELRAYTDAMQSDLLEALLSGRQSVPELLERAKRLSLDFTAESYTVIYMILDVEHTQAEDSAVQLATHQEAFTHAFAAREGVYLCNIAGDGIAFFLLADAEKMQEKVDQCVADANAVCKRMQSIQGIDTWEMETGTPVSRLSQIPECFRQARKNLMHRRVGRMLQEQPRMDALPAQLDFDPNAMDVKRLEQRVIEKFLSSAQLDHVADFVEEYIQAVGEDAMGSLLFRQYILLHIQFSINAFVNSLEDKNAAMVKPQEEIGFSAALGTIEDTKRYLCQRLRAAIEARDLAAGKKYSNIVAKAVAYMQEHFAQADISLNTVAQVVSVRSTYFSAVFSQQMGKTFVEYLTELRMDKAKQLLRCTDMSSGNIAFTVGYNDAHYFSFLFKKINGCSPRDYRAGKEGAPK